MANLDSPPDHQESDPIMWNLGIPIGFIDIAFCCTLMSNPVPCLASKELAFWPLRVPIEGPTPIEAKGPLPSVSSSDPPGDVFQSPAQSKPISKQKKNLEKGESPRCFFGNSMESSGKFETTKKNTPKFDVKNSLGKTWQKSLDVSLQLDGFITESDTSRRRGVMVFTDSAPQRSRRWSLKFLELIGGSSKCPQSNAGLPKVDMNESKVGSPGVTAADKKQVTLSWKSLVLSRQSINLASEPLHILSDISRYCDVSRAKMWRLIA